MSGIVEMMLPAQTHNPVLVAAAAMASQLPWLLFGLVAGALADGSTGE
jgi:hypothetical protein